MFILVGCFAGGEYPKVRAPEILTNKMVNLVTIENLIEGKEVDLIIMYMLSRDSNYNVRAVVAAHPLAPTELLNSMAFDENWLVRLESVSNKSVGGDVKDWVVSHEKDKRFIENYDMRFSK